MAKPYTVTRSATINAPAEHIRALINDFHEWPKWSPWEDLDPEMQRTYSGAERSVGAEYAWDGNRKAGTGSMTIVGDTPDQVDIDLRFEKPFKAENRMELALTSAGSSTTVEMRMHGQLNALMQVMSIVKSMDSMVGPDFEKGLTRLKQAAENG
jgi:uncharacterized membrane protein